MSVLWTRMVSQFSDINVASADGFDAVYLNGNGLMELGAEEQRRIAQDIEKLRISVPVCSLPLPSEVRVTEKGFNLYMWGEHVKKGVRSAAALGCKSLAWSDGRARVLPFEGADVQRLKEQLLQFLWILCDTCSEYGMQVLIEPLSPRRTNFLNSMDETMKYIQLIEKDNVAALMSLRELSEIGLDAGDLARYADSIGMVHVENPKALEGPRVSPRRDDGYDYHPFASALLQSSYAGPLVLPADADADALAYCRSVWENA